MVINDELVYSKNNLTESSIEAIAPQYTEKGYLTLYPILKVNSPRNEFMETKSYAFGGAKLAPVSSVIFSPEEV